MKLDPVLLEIMHNKVQAAADQMGATLQRTARTLFVKEAADFATALVGLDGKLFAHPRSNGVSLFVDCDCLATIAAVPDLEPGDVIITNDAYTSGGLSTHLPDLHVIEPYFHEGRIVAYGWAFVHSTDVGGIAPGSILPTCNSYFQEGLIIPPMKLIERGVMNADVIGILRVNCRIPDENVGDIKAMLAALRLGGKRVAEMIARHGLDAFLQCHDDLKDYAAEKARAVLRRIPDGEYDFWDYMDDDFVTPLPIRLRVRMTVRDGTVHLDLTGTDHQVEASYNVATLGRMHEWLTMRFTSFLMTHDKSLPLNAGLFRHLTMTNPPATVLNAEFPSAIGLRSAPARRLNDAMTGALMRAAPAMTPAPSCGAGLTFVLSEPSADGLRQNVVVIQPMRGGMGAWDGHDGADNRDASMSNMRNHPVEIIEQDAGILIREYDVRPDSGGAGRWRGGVGQLLTVQFLQDGSKVYARGMERFRFPAWSVQGGAPAAPFRSVFNIGRPDERELGKINEVPVRAGDTITMMMPGAGGYGDPFARDVAQVAADVRRGFVSVEAARAAYGVVVSAQGAVDDAATAALRAAPRPTAPGFAFGPERAAWESVFDDATMNELAAALYALPRAVRQQRRRWLFEQALGDLAAARGRRWSDVLADPATVRDRLRHAMDTVFGAARTHRPGAA
jgi:N-methylhydantoinase B